MEKARKQESFLGPLGEAALQPGDTLTFQGDACWTSDLQNYKIIILYYFKLYACGNFLQLQ